VSKVGRPEALGLQRAAYDLAHVALRDLGTAKGRMSAEVEGQVKPVAAGFGSDVASVACDPERQGALLSWLDTASVAEQQVFMKRLFGSILRMSLDRHGCRVVQKIVELAPQSLRALLVSELKGHIVYCTEHMHGNFVIQKVVEQLSPVHMGFIVEEIEERAEALASHNYGCRVIQRLIEHCSQSQLRVMVQKILSNVEHLSKDPFGNNVIRHLLDHGSEDDQRQTMRAMCKNVAELANHKCSSLVLEKCLVVSTTGEYASRLQEERSAIVRSIIKSPGETPDTPLFEGMMLNKFGNYLCQRVIECSRGEEREIVRVRLQAAEPRLRASTTGRHILAAMRKEFGQRRGTGRAKAKV